MAYVAKYITCLSDFDLENGSLTGALSKSLEILRKA